MNTVIEYNDFHKTARKGASLSSINPFFAILSSSYSSCGSQVRILVVFKAIQSQYLLSYKP
jgi:hypothetical protein